MGTYTQRKWFDHPALAAEQANAFHLPDFKVPGLDVETAVQPEGEGAWLYLKQTSAMIDGPGMLLPEWELVDSAS